MEAAGNNEQDSGVESRNALGAGEACHAFLWQIFRRLYAADLSIDKRPVLPFSVQNKYRTAGPIGYSSVRLAPGIKPRIPINPVDLQMPQERSKVLDQARTGMVRRVACARRTLTRRCDITCL